MKDELKAGIEALKSSAPKESGSSAKVDKSGSGLAKQLLSQAREQEKSDKELTEEIESRPGHGIVRKKFDKFGGEVK